MKAHVYPLFFTLLILPVTIQAASPQRWYSAQQLQQGKPLFAEHCASCHGASAESKPNWQQRGEDGKFPPPPLNGSAHAWHHPMDLLLRVVREGGSKIGGNMPPFADKLSAAQIDSVIAWFQSLWTDEIYANWLQRDNGSLQQAASRSSDSPITRGLQKILQGAEIGPPEQTPAKGLYQTQVGSGYVYVTADGRYALTGDLIDLQSGQNLTRISRNRDIRTAIAGFPEQDMIVFPASGAETARITVFTDATCPYCRKLHEELPQIRQAGITVRYIPFPRTGTQGEGYTLMKNVWCADDRNTAMNIAKGIQAGELPAADCPQAGAVEAGYRLGQQIGLRGTPAIIMPGGEKVEGYVKAERLRAMLSMSQ